jgi:hypothetical protein
MLLYTVIPAVCIVFLLLLPLALGYNAAVTGDPLLLPYVLHAQRYGWTGHLWIEPDATIANTYSNRFLAETYQTEIARYILLSRMHWLRRILNQSMWIARRDIWPRFYGFSFSLLLFPFAGLTNRKKWIAILLAVSFLTAFVQVWILPHYSAPFAAAQFVAIAAGARACGIELRFSGEAHGWVSRPSGSCSRRRFIKIGYALLRGRIRALHSLTALWQRVESILYW